MSAFFYRNLKRQYPVVQSAQGGWVTDTSGKRYLDGCSGAVSANLGHGIAEINEAIKAQLSRVAFAHTSQFVSEAGLNLAAKLVEMAPPNFRGGRAYFACGGSEAVESALKMARGYFVEKGELSRQITIARWNSYHGSTFGAMAVTGHPARRKPYIALLKDQPHVSPAYPYRCSCGMAGVCASQECVTRLHNELESNILKLGPENVMAFIGEPIVGAALGAAVPSAGYWEGVRRICTKYGVLLIADEVMTGLGRTGTNFALDIWDVQPDIIAVGKGLAAGFVPLSAVLASGPVAAVFAEGSGVFEHGFTYSGHPLACAAGLASLEFLSKNNLIESVRKREKLFFDSLNKLATHEIVGDVRGRGFMAGIEFVREKKSKQPFRPQEKLAQSVATAALSEGLLVYPGSGFIDGVSGDHVIIAPPFTIADHELQELMARLTKTLQKVQEKLVVTR